MSTFEHQVMRSLGRIEGANEHQTRILDSHSSILRDHGERLRHMEGQTPAKKSGELSEMALQLWSKLIGAAILLLLGALTNLAPERMAHLAQLVFGSR